MQYVKELKLNEENTKWLGLLISNKEDEETFMDSSRGFLNKLSPMFGVMAFRNFLLSKKDGRGKIVSSNDLGKEVKCKEDRTKLTNALSELFLEVVTENEVDHYMDSVITTDDLIQLHNSHLTMRFASILQGHKTLLEQDRRKALRNMQS